MNTGEICAVCLIIIIGEEKLFSKWRRLKGQWTQCAVGWPQTLTAQNFKLWQSETIPRRALQWFVQTSIPQSFEHRFRCRFNHFKSWEESWYSLLLLHQLTALCVEKKKKEVSLFRVAFPSMSRPRPEINPAENCPRNAFACGKQCPARVCRSGRLKLNPTGMSETAAVLK